MARRQVGLGALNRTLASNDKYAQIATSLTTQNITDLTTQLQSFQSSLQTFALNHADEIRQNPRFRSEFARMCSSIGVDPLVGGSTSGRRGKGWNLLGVGEFWIRVAIRVVRICRATRGENGGFISVSEVKRILASEDKQTRQLSKTTIVEISEYFPKVVKRVDCRDDIVRSISSLAPLGPGLSVVTLPSGERYIRSIPKELNPDQATVLQVAGIIGFISVGMLKINLGWEDERSKSVLEELVVEGMVWVDDAGEEREYWIPRGITEL